MSNWNGRACFLDRTIIFGLHALMLRVHLRARHRLQPQMTRTLNQVLLESSFARLARKCANINFVRGLQWMRLETTIAAESTRSPYRLIRLAESADSSYRLYPSASLLLYRLLVAYRVALYRLLCHGLFKRTG